MKLLHDINTNILIYLSNPCRKKKNGEMKHFFKKKRTHPEDLVFHKKQFVTKKNLLYIVAPAVTVNTEQDELN